MRKPSTNPRDRYNPQQREQILRLAVDSGIVSAYRPAIQIKRPALIKRVVNAVKSIFERPDPSLTTEQGSAGAASPATYEASLLAQRYERRAIIQDCRQMIVDDPRARRSTLKMAKEAARSGIKISVNAELTPEFLVEKAENILKDIQGICTPSKLKSWGWMLIVEGDLFVQPVVYQRDVIGAKRMPAASMERLTDDSDEFISVDRAFAQVDVNTNEEIAPFPLALMYHARWDHIDGERYGQPSILAGRRIRRMLELAEEAKMIDRLTRAPQRKLWNIGTPDKPGTKEDVDKFKSENGFVAGSQEVFDPMNVATDFFANGMATCEVMEGSSNVDRIEDLRYFQRLYAAAALPTPPDLYGVDVQSVNRDVVEDERAEWLKEVKELQDLLDEVVRFLCDLALMLGGLDPEMIAYEAAWSDSSIEKPTEVVGRVIQQYQAGLMSKRNAVSQLAEHSGIDDVDATLSEIEDEEELRHHRDIAKNLARFKGMAEASSTSSESSSASAPGSLNGNGNGKSADKKDVKVSQIIGR